MNERTQSLSLFWQLAAMICLSTLAESAIAQSTEVETIGYRAPYTVAKPFIESLFHSGSSLDSRRHAVLKAAEVAYGTRARAALGNSVDVLAKTPGGMKIARELAIMNPSNRKGALRAARVAGAFDTDSRFRVVALEQLVKSRMGAVITDRDVVFRHRSSGSLGRIEVKDATPTSQRSNMAKYKRQIRLMAVEQHQTGQPQAFVNRRDLIPELRRYAASKGVRAYGNVVTSSAGELRPNSIPISNVLDDLDQTARSNFRMRSATAGFGVIMAVVEGQRAMDHWNQYLSGDGSIGDVSHHTLLASAGGSYAIGGVTSSLSTMINASSRSAVLLGQVGKAAPWIGAGLMVGATGVRGYQWYSGEMNTRRFTVTTVSAGGGLSGGLAGAFGGSIVGAYGGPWGSAGGAIIGGIAGAWAGQTIATYGVESYYSFLDAQQQEQLFESLMQHYQSQAQ